MNKSLRVLIVEDSEDDALLLLHELRRGGFSITHERVEAAGPFKTALEKQHWDIIISDYVLPGFSGLAALAIYNNSGFDIPFVIVSGNIGEDVAVEAMKAGAHDYIIKGNLKRLVPAIERELRDAEVRRTRKLSEDQLKQSQEKLFLTLENMNEGFFTLDHEWRFTYVNTGATKLWRKSRQELIGRSLWEVDPKSVGTIFDSEYHRAVREQVPVSFEAISPMIDIWVEARAHPNNDGLAVYFHDISGRKQSEEQISRLNSLYSVLSKVNEAIVRIRNVNDLYQEVCRIIVADGFFKMAWIGITDPETLEVKPVARWGDTGGYLDTIRVVAADVPEGNGPTGRAVFRNKFFICSDIKNDPVMLPWRDKAIKHGFLSSAAFPLRIGEEISGALTVYAATPQFFNLKEVALMSSLSEDISFAVDNINNEKKRLEAEYHIKTTNELLKLFSQSFARKDYLDELVVLLKKWCSCSCAGIRLLDEDGNVPYSSFTGFSLEFWEEENLLSIEKDPCVCTRIIAERPDPMESRFMTPGGSFVCNDTSSLMSVGAEVYPALYRGTCSKQGFASLAVIPVRYRDDKVLGAIHLADNKCENFPLLKIEFIESITPLIGEALYRFFIEESLITSREQLRNLSTHLQSAREEERTKIAREIHDELGQLLTAASMDLSRIKGKERLSAKVTERLESAAKLIDTAVQDIQRICSELRPRILDHLGLKAAIEWQSKYFSSNTGIVCHLHLSEDLGKLSGDVSTALFRIYQEGLTNIARHSGATEVEVSLQMQDNELALRVEDNGKGVTRQQLYGEKSFGVLGIRERAHELGGTATFRSARSRGTTLTVRIPMKTGGNHV